MQVIMTDLTWLKSSHGWSGSPSWLKYFVSMKKYDKGEDQKKNTLFKHSQTDTYFALRMRAACKSQKRKRVGGVRRLSE